MGYALSFMVAWVVVALALGPGVAGADEASGSALPAGSPAPEALEVPALPPLAPPSEAPSGPSTLPGTLLPPSEAPVPPGGRPGFEVLPAAVSLGPGLLLHGLGPLVAGDTRTAGRLFALQGAGLGLLFAGGVPIALTGASRRTIAPLYAVTAAGVGLFALSALANLYGAVAPAFEPGVAPRWLPPLELEAGYQHVSDAKFDYRHFLALGVVARGEWTRLEAAVRLAPQEGNTRLRLVGAWRLLGASERATGGADGSSLDMEGGALYHRYPTEGFSISGVELGLRGRYAMARLSPRLAGSFAEMSVGTVALGYGFTDGVHDDGFHQNLLFTFGYGVWLGRGGPLRGEALLYYNHRKDDYVGGAGDIAGGVGLRARVLLGERWGVSAEGQLGSAYVGRLGLVYTLGGEP